MKKLLLVAFLAITSFFAQAQTKGTNTIGLGLNFQTQKVEQNFQGNQFSNEQKSAGFNLGYGYFIKDNERMGIDFFYGKNESNNMVNTEFKSESYGGNLTYQRYFPLLKKFYAFGGGRVGYNYGEGNDLSNNRSTDFSSDTYLLGAYGGVTWFLSKRIALEADLLSANINYSKLKNKDNDSNVNFKSTSRSFNLNTSGVINGLGFKIYFLF